MRVRRAEEENFELMLVPMIDCLFILLIFFMVATTLKVTKKEVPITLPNSGAAIDQKQEETTVVVGIDAAGGKYVDGEPVTTQTLHDKLMAIAAKSRKTRVRIDADENARGSQIVEVLDLCQFEGLRNVGFHTRDDKPAK